MSCELIHTSVEKGLRGVSGFATAVASRGLPAVLEPALEELSAYDFDASRVLGADRVDWAYRIVMQNGRSFSVLSRTAPCGSDWSGRPNRVAHHVVLEPSERGAAGPVWALTSFRSFAESAPPVEERASGPTIAQGGEVAPHPASAWIAAGFDAGWAGLVARMVLDSHGASCYLVLPPETSTLPLLEDVFALLSEDRRWHITFSTRFQRVGANARCQLRCVRQGAPSLRTLLAEPGVRHLHVERGASAGESEAADAGRRGVVVEPVQKASTRVDPVLRTVTAHSERNELGGSSDARSSSGRAAPVQSAGVGGLQDSAWSPPTAWYTPAPGRNLAASILFGIAAVALLTSFILGVLIVLRR